MKVNPPNQTRDFEPCPEGIHPFRIYQIVDLGTQTDEFRGDNKSRHQVRIVGEILSSDVSMEDGRPFAIGVTRTVSLHEKSRLRKDLEAIRGKAYTELELNEVDLIRLAGAYCKVFVMHVPRKDGGIAAKIERFMKWPANEEKPQGFNPISLFDFEDPSEASFENLPEWIQNTIKKSPEFDLWQSTKTPHRATGRPEFDDDIPI